MSLSGIHTQATNFTDFIKTGVDARTGQFTVAFQLPIIPANYLAGPSLTPTLAFSVLGSTRNRGFGLGWSLDLSELNLHQDAPSLRLSSGEQFAVDLDSSELTPGGQLAFHDAKLVSMIVTCQSEDVFRVDHKSGQTELLTRQQDSSRYLVTEIRSTEGRRVFVEWSAYRNGDFILDSIRDESRTLLEIETEEGEVRFVTCGLKTDAVRLQLTNDKLSDVHLPGIKTPFSVIYEHHQLDESSQLLLPVEVNSPLGAWDHVTWGTGEHGHQLPTGAPFEVLPRVVEWKHSSGTESTELLRSYEWAGVHNFLGYGSDQAFDWQRGQDNLYEVEQDYDYEVVETQTNHHGSTLATITRTWNRFHLPTREMTSRGSCQVHTETTFGLAPATAWRDQPGWCQLPHEQTVTLTDHRAQGQQRSQHTEYRYDEFGNLVFTRSPDGIEEHCEYYPAEGAEGCPANPLSMIRHIKKKTVKPARLEDGTFGGASEISTTFTYTSLASLIEGEPPFVLVASEQVRDETNARALETTTQTYVREKGPGYARLSSKITQLNGRPTTTSYRYEFEGDELSTHVTVTGFENTEQVRMSQSSSRSLTSGQMMRERSMAGVLSRYAYDALGRMILSITADDSRYQAARTTAYHVGDEIAMEHRIRDENPVMIEHVLATGQHRRDWLDGEGRTVRIEVQDIDQAPEQFRETARTTYDPEGRATHQTQKDWLRDERDPSSVTALELITTARYDDWGQITCTTTPDGVQHHTQHDPVKLTVRQWQENGDTKGPSRITRLNVAGQPVLEQFYDTEGVLVRSTQLLRDGLDRVTQTRIVVPEQPDRVNTVRHDAYSRIVEQHLPDGTVLNWTYALHSDNNHPDSIAVTAPLAQA